MSDLTLTWAQVHACLAAKYGKRAFDALDDLLCATIGSERLMDKAADEIERLRALSDQLAEALREVSEITKVLHGRGDLADCLIQSFTTLAAYEAARKEKDNHAHD